MSKIPVGVLGATGTVGQRFIQLLESHPLLQVKAVGASERSAGKLYGECTNWKLDTALPENVASMVVQRCDPQWFQDCRVIFSGLDASVAGEVELEFLKHEFAVFSNAKNHRMDPFVPLVVPLVNTDHLEIIQHQRQKHSLTKGFLVTNANCSTTGLVVVLKALQDAFGPLSTVVVTTMQAISGAGYPGIPSLDILGNVVPFIPGEEEKIQEEAAKILGRVHTEGIEAVTGMKVSASCNRVPVLDGHTTSLFVQFKNKAPTPLQVAEALTSYRCEAQRLQTHSAPLQAIVVTPLQDRPQPRLDALIEGGNAVIVGRIRECSVFDIKLSLLSHNTILGAAGSSIMNAEVAYSKGLL